MIKNIIIAIIGLTAGVLCSYFILIRFFPSVMNSSEHVLTEISALTKRAEVIGFLPYWLVSDANKDYTKYLTTLTYFGLTITKDGTFERLINPGEEEPGWYTLHSGKIDGLLQQAKITHTKKSLLIFCGDEETIGQLISDPIPHAQNLVEDVTPIMKKYGFTDLNLDIESVSVASDSARQNFTTFVKEVRRQVKNKNLGTLTIEASPTVLIKKYLIDLQNVAPLTDRIVLMMYDFHFPGSYVTGPVSPVSGAGIESEFDSEVGIKLATKMIPLYKIILGIPLYGYEWETLRDTDRSATIPGTGIAASNRRVEDLLKTCDTCSIKTDTTAKESYLIYKDKDTGTYHQIFYPDEQATQEKIKLAHQYHIGGLALWALGYDGNTILNPLEEYKNSIQ